MAKRDIIELGKKDKSYHYAERDAKGRFAEISSIGKSITEDRRIRAKKVVKPGHGHEGDLKK